MVEEAGGGDGLLAILLAIFMVKKSKHLHTALLPLRVFFEFASLLLLTCRRSLSQLPGVVTLLEFVRDLYFHLSS